MEVDVKNDDDGHPMSMAETSDSDTPLSLRRSTRASAMRATEKLKVSPEGKHDEPIAPVKRELSLNKPLQPGTRKTNLNTKKAKKRKSAIGLALDPSDPHFAVQETEDGDVVVLSDDSVVSSLNDEEIDFLKKNYEKMVCAELDEEARRERQKMIRQLQAELRAEEAKLVLLKKMKLTQSVQTPSAKAVANLAASQNLPRPGQVRPPVPGSKNVPPPLLKAPQQAGAYRPPLAGPNQHRPGGVPGQFTPGARPQAGGGGNFGSLAPKPAHQSGLPHAQGNAIQKTQQLPQPAHGLRTNAMGGLDLQTPEQKQAAAKLLLRKQLEKTLRQIPPPKPPPPELNFIPNPNQPELLYYFGMDYIVQRLREHQNRRQIKQAKKDAAAAAESGQAAPAQPEIKEMKRVADVLPDEPYLCVQCGIDFTPQWRTVSIKGKGGAEDQQVIMCEQCVKSNQKRALKAEHNNRLKTAFVKALQQEQEIEKQIQRGDLNLALLQGQVSTSAGASHSNTLGGSSGARASPITTSGLGGTSANAAAFLAARNAASGSSLPRGQMSGVTAPNLSQLSAVQQAAAAAAAFAPNPAMLGWNPLFAARFGAAGAAANLNYANLQKEMLKSMAAGQQQMSTQQQLEFQRRLLDMMSWRPNK